MNDGNAYSQAGTESGILNVKVGARASVTGSGVVIMHMEDPVVQPEGHHSVWDASVPHTVRCFWLTADDLFR